jgi:predicted transcriptional regulator
MMRSAEQERYARVEDYMSRELVTVEYEGTIDDALARMVEKGQNTVMVMDQRALVGLIGDVDIGRLVAKGVDIKKALIRDFVTACILTGNQPCVQIRQDEMVVNALKVMDSWGAAQIVVVDEDNKVVGTLSVLDALKGWREEVRKE